MKKDFNFIELFEYYGSLLTDKQRELFNSYYMLDLSLSEIAENEGSTRQSVFDAIKKVENKLTEYESKLKLKDKLSQILVVLDKTTNTQLKNEITEIIKR